MSINKHENLEKKIAQLMANLPDDKILEQNLTTDQVAEWNKIREVQQLLALEWRQEYYLEGGSYAIEEAYDNREISLSKKKLLLNAIKEQKNLWELIKKVEPLIKQKYLLLTQLYGKSAVSEKTTYKFNFPCEYPFRSDFDLFACILKEETEEVFYDCVKPYVEKPAKKWRKVLNILISKEINLKKLQKIKNNLKWQTEINKWRFLVLFSASVFAIEDPEIQKVMTKYTISFEELLKTGSTAARQIPSKAWEKGRLKQGTSQGGIYQ